MSELDRNLWVVPKDVIFHGPELNSISVVRGKKVAKKFKFNWCFGAIYPKEGVFTRDHFVDLLKLGKKVYLHAHSEDEEWNESIKQFCGATFIYSRTYPWVIKKMAKIRKKRESQRISNSMPANRSKIQFRQLLGREGDGVKSQHGVVS